MATGALNVFRTVAIEVAETPISEVYEAPEGYTAIILMAQVSNVTTSPESVTFSHVVPGSPDVSTELLKDFSVPGNDAVSATTGKLVLETGHQIWISAGANDTLKLVLSILESANE